MRKRSQEVSGRTWKWAKLLEANLWAACTPPGRSGGGGNGGGCGIRCMTISAGWVFLGCSCGAGQTAAAPAFAPEGLPASPRQSPKRHRRDAPCAIPAKARNPFCIFLFQKYRHSFGSSIRFAGCCLYFPGNERDFPLFFELVYFFLSSTIFRIYLFVYLELPILQLFVMQSKHFLTIFSKLWTNYVCIVNSVKFCRAFLWSLSLDFAAEVGDNGAVETGHYAPIRKILYVSRRSPND